MYLFSRRTRLAGGNGMAGVEWAVGMAAKVKAVTGTEVQLWASTYSPGFGEISWTAWFETMTALESMSDQLTADSSYNDMANAGFGFVEGGVDDAVMQLIHGAPDPARDVQYVVGTQAIVAGGAFARAMGVGIELVEHGLATTGIPTMFVRGVTGMYGAVGWLAGYASMAELEKAMDVQAADPAWLKMIDDTKGCFSEDLGATSTTLYRKLA